MAGKSNRVLVVSPEGLELLTAAKARLGLSFAAIAERAGVSMGTVQRLFHPERGKGVRQESAEKITALLEMHPEQIVSSFLTVDAEAALLEAENRIQKALDQKSTRLNLANLGLYSVPSSLGALRQLEVLDISRNRLSNSPHEIRNLVNLKTLDISLNRLTKFRIDPHENKNIKELKLQGNLLEALPEEIGELGSLLTLSVSFNKISYLPDSIGNLASLTSLYVYRNQISYIPEEVGLLSNLIRIHANDNRLTSIPKSLKMLVKLKLLELGNNDLNKDPDCFACLPKTIQELYLYGNNLSFFPEILLEINDLQRLDIDTNKISFIPKGINKLKKLKQLFASKNELLKIPETLKDLEYLEVLMLDGNEGLSIPPNILGPSIDEVVNRGDEPVSAKDIINYYLASLKDHTPLNEAKLILVGFGAVGKTSLVNRLIHDTFDPKSAKTEGIQITQWPLRLNDAEDITLHVWDFGGQEIMHSTHQFFLTERSLYLLVLNGRQGHEGHCQIIE